jgi:hypothetical protein
MHLAAVATAKGVSKVTAKRLSGFVGFSSAIMPDTVTERAEHTVVDMSSPAATESAANDPTQLRHLKHAHTSALSKMHAKVRSLAENAILADVDDDLRMQLDKCALKLETLLGDNLVDEFTTALHKMHLAVLSLTADAMLAEVDDGGNLKVQLEKCALKLQRLLSGSEGVNNSPLSICHDERADADIAGNMKYDLRADQYRS